LVEFLRVCRLSAAPKEIKTYENGADFSSKKLREGCVKEGVE
jgi:hypothetical protein